MNWLPRTKFLRPEPDEDILDRPELVDRLRTAVTSKRLTLISAQAGAGKTTLVASLGERYPEMSMGWISLDEGDNDLEQFLTLLTQSARRVLPACTLNSAALIRRQPDLASAPQRLMGLFINDIMDCRPEPFMLVLDDIHTIDDEHCLVALDYLLAHLPPALHLVMTTRSDPPLALARLRARGQMAEINMTHLRFSLEETSAWLKAALSLTLSQEALKLIAQQTEGWVTGLRLLVLSLQEQNDAERAQIMRAFNRRQRLSFDYLMEEVVHQLPQDEQRFLLDTSILSLLTPAYGHAVSGRADAGQILELLCRRNMFIYHTDEGPSVEPTYRVHALLRQALQQELRLRAPDRLPELHRRAAAALGVTPSAVEHYLLAEAWDAAADVLERLVRNQVELGSMPARLVTQISRLPETVVAQRPWLRAAQGISLLLRGRKEEGQPLLEEAAQKLADAGDELSWAYLLFNLSNVSVGAEMDTYLAQIGAVFAARGNEVPPRWRVDYHHALVWQHLHVHDWPAVEEHLETAVDIAIRANEPGAYYTLATNNFTHFFYSERATAAVLRLKDALQTRLPADDLLARLGIINISLCQHWYAGEPELAEKLALQAQWTSRRYGIISWADANAMLVLTYCQWLRDDLPALKSALQGVIERMAEAEAWNVARNDLLCWLSFVLWREGHGADARAFLADMEAYTVWDRQRINTSLTRALVASGADDLSGADRHLRDALALQRKVKFTATVGAQLLRAVIYWQAGEQETALRELEVALNEWQRRDLPGVVLQTGQALVPLLEAAVREDVHASFAGRCLDAFGAGIPPRPRFVETTGETLTAREAEVLGLLAEGMTNPQIAQHLVISETTVKSHVSKVLAKMAVSRRTEAAMLAQELNLV